MRGIRLSQVKQLSDCVKEFEIVNITHEIISELEYMSQNVTDGNRQGKDFAEFKAQNMRKRIGKISE